MTGLLFSTKLFFLSRYNILGPIPAFYDLPSQSYTFTQLTFNYPIISIISKTKYKIAKVIKIHLVGFILIPDPLTLD